MVNKAEVKLKPEGENSQAEPEKQKTSEKVYVSKYPSTTVQLSDGNVKFKDGKLVLTDPDQIAEFDELLSRKPTMRTVIYDQDKTDADMLAAAEKLAAQHQAQTTTGTNPNAQIQTAIAGLVENQRDLGSTN